MASFQVMSLLLVCIIAAILVVGTTAQPDVSVRASACDGRDISLVSDYAHARGYVLDEAVDKTPGIGFDFHGHSRYMSVACFFHGKCLGGMKIEECRNCMRIAMMDVLRYCTTNTEGWVQLQDCYVGYYEFSN